MYSGLMPSRSRDRSNELGGVVQGEGPHADQMLDARRAPLQVAAQDDLGVAVGAEHVTARAQLVAHLDVVVDLAVLGQRETTGLVAHGHVAVLAQVEDAQALIGQRRSAKRGQATVVRAAVALSGGHGAQGVQVSGRDSRLVESVNPGNAAHAQLLWTDERAWRASVPPGTSTRVVLRRSGNVARTAYTSTVAGSRWP